MCFENDIDYSWLERMQQDFLMISVHRLSESNEVKKLKESKTLAGAIKASVDILQNADLISNKTPSLGNFMLPSPNQITETISHTYNDNSLPVESTLTKGLLNTITSGTGLNNFVSYAEEQLTRHAMFLDPKIVNVYEKTPPRQYSLSFVLFPKSKVEAQAYVDIITCLKEISKAEEQKLNNLLPYLKQDIVVSFEFQGDLHKNNFTNKLLLCDGANSNGFFIVNVQSNIQSIMGGYSLMYEDGMPKSITMELQLIERKPLYFDFWENKDKLEQE